MNTLDKFVLQVPKWQGELLFSRELLFFLGVILLMVVGTLFCFWGYKYFSTVLLLGIGTVVCCASYILSERMTPILVIRLFLTVSLTFFGVCMVYFLAMIIDYILDRLRIRQALGRRIYLLAAPLGAVILGLTIYYGIWHDGIVAAVISAVCLACGLPFQHVRRKKQVRFCCYNDLLRLKRPKLDEDGVKPVVIKAEPESVLMEAGLVETETDLRQGEPVSVSVPVTERQTQMIEEADDGIEYQLPVRTRQDDGNMEDVVFAGRVKTGADTAHRAHDREKAARRARRKMGKRIAQGMIMAAIVVFGIFLADRASRGRE